MQNHMSPDDIKQCRALGALLCPEHARMAGKREVQHEHRRQGYGFRHPERHPNGAFVCLDSMEEPTDDNAWQDRVDAMLDVRAAMKSLTARERGAVVLWVCGYTPAEVAELLGVSQGTVRHIRRRALWKMKKTSA